MEHLTPVFDAEEHVVSHFICVCGERVERGIVNVAGHTCVESGTLVMLPSVEDAVADFQKFYEETSGLKLPSILVDFFS